MTSVPGSRSSVFRATYIAFVPELTAWRNRRPDIVRTRLAIRSVFNTTVDHRTGRGEFRGYELQDGAALPLSKWRPPRQGHRELAAHRAPMAASGSALTFAGIDVRGCPNTHGRPDLRTLWLNEGEPSSVQTAIL